MTKDIFFTKQSQELLDTFLKEVDPDTLSAEHSLYEKCHGKTNGAIEVCFSRITTPNECPSIITNGIWSPISNYTFSDCAAHADLPEHRQLLVTLA